MSDALNVISNHPLATGGVGLGVTTVSHVNDDTWPLIHAVHEAFPWVEVGQIIGPFVVAIALVTWIIKTAIPWTTNKAIPFFKRQLDRLKH